MSKEEVIPETAKLVVVAAVVVEFEAVKLWRVVEPLNKALVNKAKTEVKLPRKEVFALRSVVLALPEA